MVAAASLASVAVLILSVSSAAFLVSASACASSSRSFRTSFTCRKW